MDAPINRTRPTNERNRRSNYTELLPTGESKRPNYKNTSNDDTFEQTGAFAVSTIVIESANVWHFQVIHPRAISNLNLNSLAINS